jgi:Uma2 family endonuclease
MTVPEFLDWAGEHPGTRYELVGGRPVAMAPEKVRHTVVKFSAARALDDAVRDTGLPCRVFADGVSVAIDEHTVREPDCSVQCTEPDLDSMFIDAPMIVGEVTSPSSTRDDTGAKLVEYFSVPSIVHYIIVRPDQSVVIHHRRDTGGAIATQIRGDGDIDLTPPGISVPVARLLGAA